MDDAPVSGSPWRWIGAAVLRVRVNASEQFQREARRSCSARRAHERTSWIPWFGQHLLSSS